jgi:hypothetical protein
VRKLNASRIVSLLRRLVEIMEAKHHTDVANELRAVANNGGRRYKQVSARIISIRVVVPRSVGAAVHITSAGSRERGCTT